MQNNNVFITGAAGFVGSHILNQLIQDGFSGIAMYHRNVPLNHQGIEWIQGDLLNPVGFEMYLKNVNTIVHVAGMISYLQKDQAKLFAANYLATKELVDLALFYGVQNFIYISSASTLIRSVNPLHIAIKASGTPVFNSYYAKTKFLAELEVRRAAAEGMNFCILNPSLVIGHWNWNCSSMQIFKKVKSGISFYPPGNLGIIAATDLAQIVSSICKDVISEQQFLVNAEVWSYKDFLNEIALSLHQKPIQRKASYYVAKAMALVEGFQSLWNGKKTLITNETIKSCFTKYNYEDSPIAQTLNLKYSNIRKLIHEISSIDADSS